MSEENKTCPPGKTSKPQSPSPKKPSQKSGQGPQELAPSKLNQIMQKVGTLNVDFIKNLLGYSKGGAPGMGDAAKAVGRPMKYPYTFAAKIAQFPYKFHMNQGWLFKYYVYGVIVTLPFFYKLGKASYSPENVRTWEEIRKRDFTPGAHH